MKQKILKIILALGLSASLSAVLLSSVAVAQSDNAKKIVPVIMLLLLDDNDNDNDNCLNAITVGDVILDSQSPQCFVEDSGVESPTKFYSFSHSGGPLHIDLISRLPNSFNPLLSLRHGIGKDGDVINTDSSTHDDALGARLVFSALTAGPYTIQVWNINVNANQGAFNLSVYADKVTAKATGKLNDTGISYAGISETTNSSNCAAVSDNQDCASGRDADSNIGYQLLANDGDGEGGFSFQQVTSTGAPKVPKSTNYFLILNLPPTPSIPPNPWSCVKDNVTGLMWEVKTNSGIHNNADTYAHGDATPTSSGTCSNNAAICNTDSFVDAVNTATLCGYDDWRLPTPRELLGLFNYNKWATTHIDKTFFPNTRDIRSNRPTLFWSVSPYAPDPTMFAWGVVFETSDVTHFSRNDDFQVRLVRGNQ